MSEPFSVPVSVAQIPASGKRFRIEPDENQRLAMAAALEIASVEHLTAAIDVVPVGDDAFAVRGSVTASVVQTDVVTLEPIEQDVEEIVDLTLAPAASESHSRRRGSLDEAEVADVDERDVYRGGRIDLGAIVFEHLALGLDPYPKAPGTEFSGHIEDDPAKTPSAFAALAALKREKE